jgi:hypothetical protein
LRNKIAVLIERTLAQRQLAQCKLIFVVQSSDGLKASNKAIVCHARPGTMVEPALSSAAPARDLLMGLLRSCIVK